MHIEFEGIVGPVEVLLGHDRHLSTGRMNLPASRNPNRIIELYQAWLDKKLRSPLQSLIARGPEPRFGGSERDEPFIRFADLIRPSDHRSSRSAAGDAGSSMSAAITGTSGWLVRLNDFAAPSDANAC